MSNLEDHEAEQAAITAQCTAGTCDHPECAADRKSKVRYNHAYDFACEVISHSEDASDVTPAMLIAALRDRINRLEEAGGREIFAACDNYDTYIMEADQHDRPT